jgi:lactoylglutathione lyase
MSGPGLSATAGAPAVGYAHVALTVGSPVDVDALTEQLRRQGVRVVSGPRQTGDGYYESVVEDPDGNLIELTAG